MGKVMVSLSMSLDGFIAGPDDGVERPLGIGGERLFAWMAGGPSGDAERSEWLEARVGGAGPPPASQPVIEGWVADCGAIVSGRRTFDVAGGWKEGHPIDVPIFVVTHDPPTEGEWSPRVTFVTGGLDRALELAQEAAGGLAVSVAAASIVQQLLRAGKIDEIEVSVAPCLLGSGVRLFEHLAASPIHLEQDRIVPSDGVTHLRYRVVR